MVPLNQVNPLTKDPYHLLLARFFYEELTKLPEGRILEIGSRSRSGITRTELVPSHLEYTGIDIIDGPNVDVVGDAHSLGRHFQQNTFDAVYSMSVFEHLAMPWKVAVEINKILKPSGVMLHTSHQSWPIHEAPCDYWRYSENTWKSIFNSKTGFEIIDSKMGEPAKLQPDYDHPGLGNLTQAPCYLASAVICKKTTETTLDWDMELSDIEANTYPH